MSNNKTKKNRRGQNDRALEIVHLLTNGDAQVLAYGNTLMNPFAAPPARCPILATNGIVPVDLYIANASKDLTTSSTNQLAYAAYMPDGWHQTSTLGRYLVPDGTAAGTSFPGFITNAGYAGLGIPASGSTPGGTAGLVGVDMPEVSSNIQATGETEYIQVSGGMRIQAAGTGSALPDAQYQGILHVVTTLDPVRFPLTGKTHSQIWTAAKRTGSVVSCWRYIIQPNGSFKYQGGYSSGRYHPYRSDDEGNNVEPAVPTITTAAVPVTVTAWEWSVVDGNYSNTFINPAAVFILSACPSPATFTVDYVWNYQLEKYPSNKYEKIPNPVMAPVNTAKAMLQAITQMPTTHSSESAVHPKAVPAMLHAMSQDRGFFGHIVNSIYQKGSQVLKPLFGELAGHASRSIIDYAQGKIKSFISHPLKSLESAAVKTVPKIEEILESGELLPLLAL